MTDAAQSELVIVTGMSGAGRTTAANALEDLGWYVVDNLPAPMLQPLVDLAGRAGEAVPKLAVVLDVRGDRLSSDPDLKLDALRGRLGVRVLFLDASDAALVRRFEQVRRPHPLQADGTILDGISRERGRLQALRELSEVIIDTSELNVHQLAAVITDLFTIDPDVTLRITVQSFGFKYGLPADADMVADARFIPNPYWEPELRPRDGRDPLVSDFVLSRPGVTEFVERYTAALAPVLEGYQREQKRHGTIAIGCTGGKHRSVAIVEAIAARLRAVPGVAVSVKHRDVGRE